MFLMLFTMMRPGHFLFEITTSSLKTYNEKKWIVGLKKK